jgi:hypothetical protein
MQAIVAIQESLSITDPVKAQIKRAYPYVPDFGVGAPATPMMMNEWSFDREDRTNQGLRQQYYTVHMQLLVYDAKTDRAADIATAFMEPIVDAFDAADVLHGAAFWTKLRGRAGAGGSVPTLFPVTWAGKKHMGLDLFLDLTLTEGKTYAR